MQIKELKPKKALNKAYLKVKPNRSEIENFKSNLILLLDRMNDAESEEFHKNLVSDFLKDTYYKQNHFINTKGRNDLVIHNKSNAISTVGVILEAKKPTNKTEMITKEKLNTKAFHELILYYLRERITHHNLEVKHLVITNIYEWFIFDAVVFDRLFAQNKNLVKQFSDFEGGRLSDTKTDFFYKQIAEPFVSAVTNEIEYTYFNLQEYQKPLRNEDKKDDKELIALFKLLSPEHLLKLPFANDSNSLDKRFYSELLHIIGLTETKEGSKKLIQRNSKNERNSGSILEDAIIQLESLDKINRLEKPSQYGNTQEERLFNAALELSITWINRILFLKLLEGQLINYHKGDKSYAFLNIDKIKNYDDLNSLFFQVLARKHEERNSDVKLQFEKVPYLNSSLFEPTDIEHSTLFISNLRDDKPLPLISSTVLKNDQGKKHTGSLSTLQYLFEFLNAYDFSSEGSEEIQEDNKTLINASVLGLIFEKINGYKDGSFYTPGFITMYMCRETIRKAVVQKFNETKGWNCESTDEVYNKIDDIKEANDIVNSIKICDPAVGSGHFLVSALNEMIAVKSDLNILQDRKGRRLKEYHVEVVNDELIVTDEEGEFFEYNPNNKESQRIQETLFHEKQTIIENCLFGVDINPNSVKICRLRLWIELLKNAYYKNDTELETLPNIDINIKAGNSLVSRFPLDADLKQALKKSKWTIDSYKLAVATYRNAESKEQKREMERLIADIKGGFRSEISKNDPKVRKLQRLEGELFNLTNQTQMFEMSVAEKTIWEKKVKELTTETEKLEAEIEEIKANKIFENAFEWRFEFPEVLNDGGDFVGFDVVIGNPPYIDAKKLANISDHLRNNYLVYFSSADLSSYFFELSFNILKSNGFFSFISTNKFFKTEYGKTLRKFISNFKTHSIINFEQVPIFEEALVSSLIIVIEKASKKSNFSYVEFIKEQSPSNSFEGLIYERQKFLPNSMIDEESWDFSSQKESQIIKKLFSGSKKIKEIDSIDIKRGVTTGFDPAFIINNQEYQLFIENDIANTIIIKPLLKGKEIKKYFNKKSDLHLIFIEWHFPNQIASKSLEENEKDLATNYPYLYHHFLKYKNELSSRNKEETGIRYEWYALQRCAASYYNNFDKPKIVWPLTAANWGFAIDTEKHYLSSGGFMMISESLDLRYLLAVLNSSLMEFLFSKIGVMTAGGAFTLKKATIDEFPIKLIDNEMQIQYIELVDKIFSIKQQNPSADTTELENQIDQLVYELYGLTEEEIKIVEGIA